MSGDEHHTIRLLLFEVYEAGSDFPLFVTSDSTEAHSAATQAGDRIVRRYWVREGLDVHGAVDPDIAADLSSVLSLPGVQPRGAQ